MRIQSFFMSLMCGVLFVGCRGSSDDAAVMPNTRVAFPVKSMRIGDIMYVTADALRLDKSTHKLYVYTAAPTFVAPANSANIAIKRNDKGYDVDLTLNTDMFIPIEKPGDSEEAPIISLNAPSIQQPTQRDPVVEPTKDANKLDQKDSK